MRRSFAGAFGSNLYWSVVYGLGALALVYLNAPVVIALIMSFTDGQTLKFPPPGLSLRWYLALLDPVESGPLITAALNSLKIAVLAVIGSCLFAIPASVGASRFTPRSAALIEPLFVAPLVLPSLVYGLAALMAATAVGIRPSLALVTVGHIVVFGPLMYRATSAVASTLDPHLEEASTTLGATRLRTFFFINLPLLLPGILAGVFLVFIQSIDNVSVSLFLADPATSVLPLRMFQMLEEWLDVRVAAMSGVLIGFTVVIVLIGLRVVPLFRIFR